MDTNNQKEHYTIESGRQLIRVSNLLITHIGVSLFFLLVVSVSLQSGNTGSLLVLNLFFVVFSLVVLGMGIYSLRMSGVNLIKSINPNYQPSGIYVVPSSNPYERPFNHPYPQTIQSQSKPQVSNLPINETQITDDLSVLSQNQITDDGSFVNYRKNGKLHSKGVLKNGVRDGVYESYDEEGVLESIITYKNGIRDGLFERYYVNGTVFERGTYKDDRLSGEYQIFTYDGKLKKTKYY